MKCYACGKNTTLSQWRTVNLEPVKKTTIKSSGTSVGLSRTHPINYYTVPGSSRFSNIYACPHCGTLRVRTPTDKN